MAEIEKNLEKTNNVLLQKGSSVVLADNRTSFYGGGGWIRTTVGIASRFTVCPLWPLGNTPVFCCRDVPPPEEAVELVDGFEPPTC